MFYSAASSLTWTTEWTLLHKKGNLWVHSEVWREEDKIALLDTNCSVFQMLFLLHMKGTCSFFSVTLNFFLSQIRRSKGGVSCSYWTRGLPHVFLLSFLLSGHCCLSPLPDAKMRSLGHTKACKVAGTAGELKHRALLDGWAHALIADPGLQPRLLGSRSPAAASISRMKEYALMLGRGLFPALWKAKVSEELVLGKSRVLSDRYENKLYTTQLFV